MGRKKTGKAELVVHEKLTSAQGLVREIIIWRMPISKRYPEGLKYRLVLADPATKKVLLLYDNHWPKGHHMHQDGHVKEYIFSTLRDLIKDFRLEADKREKRYHEDKKNKD